MTLSTTGNVQISYDHPYVRTRANLDLSTSEDIDDPQPNGIESPKASVATPEGNKIFNVKQDLFIPQLLIQHWVALRDPVWRINTVEHNACWWMFAISHGYCWATIYLGSLTMDLSELLGIKQVYYYLNGWEDPLTLKSSELQRLISHQRHPSFVSFFFIFWVHPYMSVDRLIMAVIMTLYMVCAWKVDDIDFEYQERQFKRKEIELSHVH
uniref:Nuclear envelope membrane protein n=1 Tax=Timema tahoe TaxID=61484 RepID=A0A7R9ICY0_9NEOP|nr:unnamed protein product [Timema tahoe]